MKISSLFESIKTRLFTLPAEISKLSASEVSALRDLEEKVNNSSADFWTREVVSVFGLNKENFIVYSGESSLNSYKIKLSYMEISSSPGYPTYSFQQYSALVTDKVSGEVKLDLGNCLESFTLFRGLENKATLASFSLFE